jgi:hypothetical protein
VEIIRTRYFERCLKALHASEDDIEALELAIATNLDAGDVIKGLGGARKIRFALGGKGKRGGGRAIYIVIHIENTAYLIMAYAKSDQAEISNAQRKIILELVEMLK